MRPDTNLGAVNEDEKRIVEVFLVDFWTPEKFFFQDLLALSIVRKEHTFFAPVIVGWVLPFFLLLSLPWLWRLIALLRLLEQIDADSELLAIDIESARIEPLHILALQVSAVLFERVDQANHCRVIAT